MEGSLCRFPVGGGGLVGDWCHHASAAVPASVVVEAVAPVEHDGLGGAGVDEVVPGQHFPFQAGEDASAAALSKHDPTRPIDWRMPSLRHSLVNAVAV